MKKSVRNVSVIIPAYQESISIAQVVSSTLKVLSNLKCKYEVIVVDDGSYDETGKIAFNAGAKVITHPYNKGYGASLKTGIKQSLYQSLIYLDADGQHNPNDILKLLNESEKFDMVVGARSGMQGSPIWRRPGKLLIKWLVNILTGKQIPDFNSGFRLVDREIAIRYLPIMPDGFSFSTTSTIAFFKDGYHVKYLPIKVLQRKGKSSVTILDGFKTILLIINLITLFAPLKIFMPVSLFVFFIGISFTIHSYLYTNMASLKGLLALLAAIILFMFGIMIDQIAAIRRGNCIK